MPVTKKSKKQLQEEEPKWNHPPPKGASTAWIFFNTVKSAELRQAGEKDPFSVASEIWKKMSDKDKAPWNKKAEQDKERFER